jgi:hypothetical protein
MNLRGLLALSALLVLSAAPAIGQEGSKTVEYDDFILNSVTYRVPRMFLGAKYAIPLGGETIVFRFWVSDRAPAKIEKPVGYAAFWPPEPGRPSESPDDFAVYAMAQAGNQQIVDRLQASFREARSGVLRNEYGLDCYRPGLGDIQCVTEAGRDPAAHFTLERALYAPPIMRMHAYSSKDGLFARAIFPPIGMPKGAQVLCQTYALLRTWRTSDGPAPDSCATRLTPK